MKMAQVHLAIIKLQEVQVLSLELLRLMVLILEMH
jgi:hypothetical protein